MKQFLVRRILFLIPVLLGASTLVFFFIHLIPGDPVEVMLGESAFPTDKEALRRALGLDLPVATQYGRFLAGLARGDLGRSLFQNEPVAVLIARALPATIQLAAAGLVVAILIAVPLGVLAAVRRDTLLDRGSLVLALLGVSVPNFVLAPLLILAFAIALDLFPVSGRGGPMSLALPALTLGMALAGILTRMTRSSVLEVLGAGFVATARAKGVTERRVLARHVLRNALIPLVTLVGLQLGGLLSGTLITETIFAWPGLGRLSVNAIQSRDYPLVQGCVLVIALTYVLVNFLTDVAYALLDPRIRYR